MKKILSVILATAMLLIQMTAFADVTTLGQVNKEFTNPIADKLLTESTQYDTGAFEGSPAYILQDQLSSVNKRVNAGLVSGWDTDISGGSIVSAENTKFQIIDAETTAPVTMTKKLMPHKAGKITFETAFDMEIKPSSGFFYELSGDGKPVLKLQTENDKVAVLLPDGTTKQLCGYTINEIVTLKAILDFDAKSVELIISGTNYGKFGFASDAGLLDRITVGTTKEDTPNVLIRYTHLYLNYTVNENFMSTPEGKIPYDWQFEGSGTSSVVYDPSMVYPDTYSFELSDPTAIDSAKVSKTFEDKTGKAVFETRFIIDAKAKDTVIYIGNGKTKAISLKTTADDIVLGNGTVLKKNYSANLWYTLKIVADIPAKKADIYLNYQKVLSDVAFENSVASINTISFETALRQIMNMRVDDIRVYDDILVSDYVPKPQPVKPEGNLEIGMQMYSMWNEGNHYGWDWITAYPERIPYLGTYAEGKPEVADWVTKWQLEHGFTFRTEIFSRATVNKDNPVKLPTRYHAMFEGYFNSKYKEDIKFAVLYSGISASTLGGLDDFKNNVVPFFIENFFTQPNYLLKDNKPVLFMYGAGDFVKIIGDKATAEEAIRYLDEECKKAGFDGVFYVPDGSSSAFIKEAPTFFQGNVYSYGWQYDARNSKAQLGRNDIYFASGANVVGNVTMGWGRNPWIEENPEEGAIFASPQTIKETILGLKERYAAMENPTNMITLTCWDEYGEGHFFSPTRVHGFEYLNAVRDAVTNLGPKTTEELPTAKALARMDSLYAGERRALKVFTEKPAPIYGEEMVDHSKLQVLAEWDFEKMSDLGGWKAYQQANNIRLENGALCGQATGSDPGVWIEGLNIKASDVQMIKITTKTAGAGQGQMFFQTSVDTVMGSNGKRFDVVQNDENNFKEYDGYPTDRKKLLGNITALRWDPQNYGHPNNVDFAVKKIQLLGYPTEEYKDPAAGTPITINGEKANLTRQPFTKDGVMYIAPHRLLKELKIKCAFDYPTKTYTAEVDGKVAVVKDGSNIMKLNGADVDLGAPAYYEDGNFFVPLRTFLEPLGFTVKWNNETAGIDLEKYDSNDKYPYLEKPDSSTPFSWMFETRGTEGWTMGLDLSLLEAKKGALTLEPSGIDPFVYSPTISMKAEDYKYLRIRMKNEAPAVVSSSYVLFTTADDKTWGNGKRVDFQVSVSDTEFKEYIIPLTNCDKWKGTITRLRFDPINIKQVEGGRVHIDSIEFLKELP